MNLQAMMSKNSRRRLRRGLSASLAIAFALVAAFASPACGGESGDVDTSLDTPTTRFRSLGSMQAVFDLMPKKAHNDMMEMMGGPDSIISPQGDPAMHGPHSDGGHDHAKDSHFVMLTLMDVGDRGATVTDADVKFQVRGPGGESLAEGGHVMSGKGMHHYAVGFAGGEAGVYSIEARIERGGASYSQTVKFDIAADR